MLKLSYFLVKTRQHAWALCAGTKFSLQKEVAFYKIKGIFNVKLVLKKRNINRLTLLVLDINLLNKI